MQRSIEKPKVAYLFTSYRQGVLNQYKKGENHGDGFWGMLRLQHYGIQAEHIEVEQFYGPKMVKLLRRILNVNFIHIPVFWKLFSYDLIFTSTAFGTQLLMTLLPIRKPLWVMHDFSITGVLGKVTTLKQKIFRYVVAHTAGIVAISREEERKLKQMFPQMIDKIAYIPFGVDLSFFKPDSKITEKRQILAVGFDRDRDWKTLVHACKDLDVQVILATRESRVANLKPLPTNVLVREFSVKELVEEYKQTQIVVIPLDTSAGINDAMGCSTLFESMAMQKPVIVTKTFTTESYVDDGVNGILVAEKDSIAMRNAVLSLLNDSAKREEMGRRAREYAEKYLDAEARAAELASYFKKVLLSQSRKLG